MKQPVAIILVVLFSIVSGMLMEKMVKSRELSTYKEYYNRTEELLDSVCVLDPAFIGLTETNVYSKYLEVRNQIRVEQTPE